MNRLVEARLEHDLVAPLLRRVLLTIAIAAFLITLTAAIAGIPWIALWGVGDTLIAAGLLRVARRGYLRAAALTETLALLATAIYTLTTGYGLLDVSILILPGLFLLASVLLSPRWIFAVAFLTDITVVAVGLAQRWGWLATPHSTLVTYDDIVNVVVLLTTTAVFVQYLVATMRRTIVTARVANTRTRDILDATSDAIVIHDTKDGRIVEVNASTLQMFACQREQLIGQVAKDPGNTNSPHYIDRAAEYIQRAIAGGPQSFEWLAKPSATKAFWVEVVLRSADIAGEQCVVAVLRDITSRRRLEQQVREAETFRAVGQLAGGIAHDFNNQLMGIMGNAEFLRQTATREAEFHACIDSILASSRRAADLTKQLLAFARRGRRRNVPVDLHQLITEVIALGRRSIGKRIALEQHTNAQQTVTQGDPSSLQNALLNLLVNARDAMPLGGTVLFTTRNVELTADASRMSSRALSPGQYIEIDVTDTGSGIAADVVSRVFEPFFTTKESGTGMGLAAVQGTMLDHLGSVTVVSEPGQGTTFRLLLPVVDDSIESEPARTSKPLTRGSQGRILVVDDEPTVLSVIERVLQQSGYDVTVCTGGQQAFSYYASNRFDLVLLDVMMPDLDGVEILQRLRATHPRARVMLMTGHAEENVQARLRDFADVPVLSKPFLPNELLEEVEKFSFR